MMSGGFNNYHKCVVLLLYFYLKLAVISGYNSEQEHYFTKEKTAKTHAE